MGSISGQRGRLLPSMVSGETETPPPDSRRDCWDIRLAEGLGRLGYQGRL